MSKKKISDEKIEIEVTKTFPLNKIKEIYITKSGKDEWRNKITLDNEDASYIYFALGNILNLSVPPHLHVAKDTPPIKDTGVKKENKIT